MIAVSDQCDVLIVGGGPAGSTCAWQLRQRGVDVQILDRATFPRDKVCAGWLTTRLIDALQLDLDEYRASRVLQPIESFRVSVLPACDRSVFVDYQQPVSYAIRRVEFDEYLLRRADVPVREGDGVHSIERDADGWLINGQNRARLLVGAGGHFCPVARFLRTSEESAVESHVVVAQEAEYLLTGAAATQCRVDSGTPELFFYPDLKGYAWCVRKGDWLNVGLGREGEHQLSHWRDDLISGLLEAGRIAEPPTVPFKGHAYRLNLSPHPLIAANNVLLIGDAAGLADSRSGEGIRPAVESGLLAADLIAHGNRSELAAQYAERMRDHFRSNSGNIATLLPERLRNWSARHLLRRPRFVRNVVLDRWFLNRDASLPAS